MKWVCKATYASDIPVMGWAPPRVWPQHRPWLFVRVKNHFFFLMSVTEAKVIGLKGKGYLSRLFLVIWLPKAHHKSNQPVHTHTHSLTNGRWCVDKVPAEGADWCLHLWFCCLSTLKSYKTFCFLSRITEDICFK